ncbi:MAG: RNA methyltransferase [Clostridia bacterium]|nr:RNA methyltransferase [Clostridia bacterium]
MLTSVQNTRVKEIKGLHQKKNRDREKVFLIEGVRFVEEALAAGVTVNTVIHSPKLITTLRGQELLYKAENGGVELLEVADHVLEHLADTENPQGVMAVLPQLEQGSIPPEGRLVLLVDGVQDPGNLGTIIRTADAAGVGAVLLGEGTVDLYNPKTLRSTMGSLFHLPVTRVNALEVITAMKQQGWRVAVADVQGKVEWFEADFYKPMVIVVGSEARGPREEILSIADDRLRITMPGRAESLNVAIATGVLLFEYIRQNNQLL